MYLAYHTVHCSGGVFVYGADILMDVLGISSPVDLLKKNESKGDVYNSNQVSKLNMVYCTVWCTSCTLAHLYIVNV